MLVLRSEENPMASRSNCHQPLPDKTLLCESCFPTESTAAPTPLLSTPMFDSDPYVRGIGGWLVLVLLGLIAGPFILGKDIWKDYRSLTGPNHWLISLRLPGLPAVIGFELFANLFLGGPSAAPLILLPRRPALSSPLSDLVVQHSRRPHGRVHAQPARG